MKKRFNKFLTLLAVLLLGFGQMWADLTAHVPGVYEKTVATGGYGCTLTTVASGENAGTFEVYYFSAQSKYSENTTVYNGGTKQQYRLMCTDSDSEYQLINTNGTGAFTASCDWIEMAYTTTGFSKSDYTFGTNKFNEFFEITPNGGNTGITKTCYIKPKEGDVLTLKVSGYVEFTILGNDNGSSKYMTVTVDGGTPTSWKSNTLSRRSVALTTGEHTIVVANVGNSANAFYGFSLKLPATPSCEDPETALSLSSDAAATVYVGDVITFSTTGGNGGTVTIAGAASETITDNKWTATEGTHTFTASQAKNGNVCAQEDDLVLTVNPKTPVTSVSVAGATAGYLNDEVTFTATAEYAASYRWKIDGVVQSSTTATMSFTPTVAGEYSIVCEARNDFNDPGDWIASSAHTFTASKLCGELIKIVQNGQNDGIVSGILTGTKDVKLSSGTSEYDEKTGRKIGSNDYWLGVKELSKPLRAGDVATIFVTTVSAKLQLFSDKGTTLIGEMASGVVQGDNEIVLNSSATGATAIYLYRTSTAGSDMNPYVHSLSVTRSCETSTDCEIKSLTINGETITPSAKVYSYEVAAASALTEVAVAYTIHPLATGTPASGFNVTVPAAGDPANTQTITVVAEDGTHSDTYTVSVTKAASASDVVTLDALGVTGYTLDPAFDAGTLAYTITKAYGAEDPGTDKVTFTKTETEQTVDVAYDGTNHKLTVTVTAEDNTTTQDYVITINEAEAPKSLSRVLFSNGFDAFIDNANHTVKAYYLAGQAAPTATTITAGAGTAGEYAEGKITVTGEDASTVDYIVTLEAVTPNTTSVAEADPAGEFAGDEAWVKNGLLVYGNAAGYSAGDKWYVNRRLTKGTDPEDDQRVIAGWVRSYFFVGNASKFIMTVGGNNALKYAIDGGEQVANASGTLEIALTKGNHMIEIVSNQSNGDCRLSAPKLVELPPTFSVTYMPNGGTGAEYIVDDDASEVAAGSIFTAPASSIFAGWNTQADGNGVAYAAGDAVTEDLVLYAQWSSYFTITYMDGETQLDTEDVLEGDAPVGIADPVKFANDFAGWTLYGSDEVIDVTALSASTTVYAKWTPFAGCTLWYPATSGAALNVGDNVDMLSGSFGANVAIVGMKTAGSSIAYDARGLLMGGGSGDIISVTLNNDMDIDTKISVTLDAKAGSRARGLYLLNGTGGSVKGGTLLGWDTPGDDVAEGEIETFSYTVEDADGLAGTNVFRLKRQNSTYIKCIKVESCGAAITYHNLTSAVNIAGKGTVTLGATSVREGYTTTAEYSDIDPLYEFVNWTVSGAGASVENATANPATITVGTEDAVVTLNLQLIPEKFTVNYFDDETPMGTEQVELNAHPTAAGIATAKRHYTFEGWADTKGGSVIDLNSITSDVVATINLYAKYAPVDCPTTGYLFSMEFDETKKPAETVVVAKNGGKVELADYATISGGNAFIQNDETSNKDAISTDGKFLLKATKEVMKIELDCALQLGDIIRIPDNNQKYVISTSNAKTGTYQQQTSSQHEFAVTSDWVGVDDIFILYDGSSLNFTQVYVYRPAKFTVSFDLKGHGAAIADLTNVPEGSKIIAPTAPTDENYTFEGWYKETTLENVWNFAEDVVTANTTLFAKWINKSDATLKSLKYGSFDIALENDVYEYNIGLPNATVAVPALTAVTNNPLATAAISDATEFDGEGKATSTVEVTPEKEGAAHQTYTVHFTILPSLPQVTVTASTLWDFSLAGNTALQNQTDVVLANMPGIINDATFNAQALKGTFNKLQGDGHSYQGSKLMFTVAEEGLLTIEFSGTNNHARHLQVCTGDGEIVIADWDYNSSSTHQTKSIEIPAGKITLKAFEGEGAQNARIYTLEYLALADRREAAWVAPGELGTVCLKDNAKALGAKVFEVMGCNASGYMVFDEILSGEIEAGRPYLFEVTRNGSVAFFKTVGAAHSDDEIEVMGMIGTFDGETLHPGTGNYCYFSGRHIWRVNDFSVDITVPAYCCYVNYDELKNHPIAAAAPAPGRRRVIMGVNGKDEAQGFENLNASETPMKVMIDGTLYILRGEKKYDATGRLVK